MPPAAKLSAGLRESPVVDGRRWIGALYRRVMLAHEAVKSLIAVGLIALVGYSDLVSGDELAFSIFYLLPIAYATWFIRPAAGVLAALISATVWFTVDTSFRTDYSSVFVPVWNTAVRLAFFCLGVASVWLAKRTQRRLAVEVLRRTRILRGEIERRRRLEREMIEMSAREQVRLAQDVHDGLGQYLSALALHARVLADDLYQAHSPHLEQAERVVTLVRTTNKITRQLDRALRVPVAEGGLLAALCELVSTEEQLTGVRCTINVPAHPVPLDDFPSVMIFRIVQEAMNNAVKHANPRLIQVDVTAENSRLVVVISDDGHGFALNPAEETGTGLKLMNLRAEMIGARLKFRLPKEGGCRVECELGLDAPVDPPPAR